MDSFNVDRDDLNASQVLSEVEMKGLDDPMDSFEAPNPMIKRVKEARKDLEDQVKKLTLSVDTQKDVLTQATQDLSAADQQVGKIQARLKLAKSFQEKENVSISEKAYVTAIPGMN